MAATPFEQHSGTESPPTYASLHPSPPSLSRQTRVVSKPAQSLPHAQFLAQTTREHDRLRYQQSIQHSSTRCPPALPFDATRSISANTHTNVRTRWVALGIWKSNWGTTNNPTTPSLPGPQSRWPHETNRDPTAGAASRPRAMFEHQIAHECVWLRYLLRSHGRNPDGVDVVTLARDSVKRFWKDCGVWSAWWGEDRPGEKWAHEELELPPPPPYGDGAGTRKRRCWEMDVEGWGGAKRRRVW